MKNLSTIPHTQNAVTPIFDDAKMDKKIYARKNGEWVAIEAEEVPQDENQNKVEIIFDKGN